MNSICAWITDVNDAISRLLLVQLIEFSVYSICRPNAHVGVNGPFIVVEGQPLRLRCSAIGYPAPHVEWLRTDNRPIPDGAWVGELNSNRFYIQICALKIKRN